MSLKVQWSTNTQGGNAAGSMASYGKNTCHFYGERDMNITQISTKDKAKILVPLIWGGGVAVNLIIESKTNFSAKQILNSGSI